MSEESFSGVLMNLGKRAPHTSDGERDEFYRLGNGVDDGKDSRSRCPDELFVLAPLVCLRLPASIPALLTGTIFSFSVGDEAALSA